MLALNTSCSAFAAAPVTVVPAIWFTALMDAEVGRCRLFDTVERLAGPSDERRKPARRRCRPFCHPDCQVARGAARSSEWRATSAKTPFGRAGIVYNSAGLCGRWLQMEHVVKLPTQSGATRRQAFVASFGIRALEPDLDLDALLAQAATHAAAGLGVERAKVSAAPSRYR